VISKQVIEEIENKRKKQNKKRKDLNTKKERKKENKKQKKTKKKEKTENRESEKRGYVVAEPSSPLFRFPIVESIPFRQQSKMTFLSSLFPFGDC
jgi:hypothetical protein